MENKVYVQAHWFMDVSKRSFCFIPAGYYEIGRQAESIKEITDVEVISLIPELEKAGFIKPRLDERLRVEDLKITHRIIDLLDKAITR